MVRVAHQPVEPPAKDSSVQPPGDLAGFKSLSRQHTLKRSARDIPC